MSDSDIEAQRLNDYYDDGERRRKRNNQIKATVGGVALTAAAGAAYYGGTKAWEKWNEPPATKSEAKDDKK